MKLRAALASLLLAFPGVAQETVPAWPADEPLPRPMELPDGPVEGAPGLVPGVRLRSDDKVGRTYAEGSPFVIWGGDRMQRSRLFTAAGMVRQAALEALRLPGDWSSPIIIQIRGPLATGTDQRLPVWTSISQVEGGFRLEINLVPRREAVPGPLLQENLVRAILADRVLRRKESLDLKGAPVPPPDWLLHGTLALMEYRQLGRMSQTFSQVFQLGRVLSVGDILNADPSVMDSVSLTLYRVSCGGLLMMLIEQPDGPAHLAALMPNLAQGGTDPALLIERAFPALSGTSNSLSKWWSLQIATLSQPGLEEVQSPQETERLLAEALVLRYVVPPAPEKRPNALRRLLGKDKSAEAAADAKPVAVVPQQAPITDFAKVLALPDPAPPFNQVDLALTRLMLRAHPVYRPLIQEYQDTARLLAKGKAGKAIPATLARLAAMREKLALTIRGIEDHLDWFEATQTTTFSGAFEGYLKTAEESEKPLPPRNDALSRYLDEVAAEYRP
jgi:hypothetical protein